MSHFAPFGVLAARIAAAGFGFFLLYLAFFLYEDEEGRYQNRLEDLWKQINRLSEKALTRNAALVKQTVGLVNVGFDSLFGAKLFSLRSVAVTFAYSVGSFALMLHLYFSYIDPFFGDGGWDMFVLIGIVIFLLAIVLGTITVFIKRRIPSLLWSIMLLGISILLCS